jgi:hypothetical protein
MGRRARLPLSAAGAALLAGTTWLLADRLEDTFFIPLDHPAIQYAGATSDPVGRLAQRLASGQLRLDYAPNGWGYLPALLQELGIRALLRCLNTSFCAEPVKNSSLRSFICRSWTPAKLSAPSAAALKSSGK